MRPADPAAASLLVHERWTALLFVLTFAAVGYGVHHLFPFYAFDMFTRGDSVVSERLAARLPDGTLREVTALQQWRCPQLPPVGIPMLPDDSPPQCLARDIMDSQERRALGHVRKNAADQPGGVAVDLVRHVWRLPTDGGAGQTYDCPLLHCTAVLP